MIFDVENPFLKLKVEFNQKLKQCDKKSLYDLPHYIHTIYVNNLNWNWK